MRLDQDFLIRKSECGECLASNTTLSRGARPIWKGGSAWSICLFLIPQYTSGVLGMQSRLP